MLESHSSINIWPYGPDQLQKGKNSSALLKPFEKWKVGQPFCMIPKVQFPLWFVKMVPSGPGQCSACIETYAAALLKWLLMQTVFLLMLLNDSKWDQLLPKNSVCLGFSSCYELKISIKFPKLILHNLNISRKFLSLNENPLQRQSSASSHVKTFLETKFS